MSSTAPILVTGAAGFIGAHCTAALLARGEQVIGLDNLNSYYDPALKQARLDRLIGGAPGFRFVHADFADPQALAAAIGPDRPQKILHLGAQAGVRYSLEAPFSYAHSNLTGQLALLELARQLESEHLVYASSSSVYGNTSALPFNAEARADDPVSLYAASKRAGELMAESYAHLFRLPMTGLRFFTVYGPWGRPDMAMWLFTKALLAGQPLPLYNGGDLKRDFTFISDIVAGTLAALDQPPVDDGQPKPGGHASPHAVYNLGNDQPEPVMAMVAALAAACGVEPVLEMLPMQAGDVHATWADIGPARADLGFAPRVPLAEGAARFVKWYRGYTGR